jgi:hypothetical protein
MKEEIFASFPAPHTYGGERSGRRGFPSAMPDSGLCGSSQSSATVPCFHCAVRSGSGALNLNLFLFS